MNTQQSKNKPASKGHVPKNSVVIIIGAMKCGTSSLYNYFIKHPNICPCVVKEPEYFSKNQAHKYNIEHYEDLWDFDPSIHRYALEASTGYTKYSFETGVPESMYQYGLNPKFIYVVRNPFDRIISNYHHVRYKHDIGKDNPVLDDHIVDVSKYHLQLEQFRKFYPKEQFLILDFDDIKADPQSVLNKTFKFLEIPEVNILDEFSVHNKTNALSKFQMFIMRKPLLRKMYMLIPQQIRDAGKKSFKKYSTPEEQRTLTEEERSVVHDRLAEDMRKFHEEYGINVKKWGFNV